MVEVFKTNVNDKNTASILIDEIHQSFVAYTANFDLDDCDKILRVKSTHGIVHPSGLIKILHRYGFTAEVLPDDQPASKANTYA